MCRKVRRPHYCLLPPFLVKQMSRSRSPGVRKAGVETLHMSTHLRASRQFSPRLLSLANMVSTSTAISTEPRKFVCDGTGRALNLLPPKENIVPIQRQTASPDVERVYDGLDKITDFFQHQFQHNSVDGNGCDLIAFIHVSQGGESMCDAVWSVDRIAIGQGGNRGFQKFLGTLDVIGHEFIHGVIEHILAPTGKPAVDPQAGALNEHFADVFGALLRQINGVDDDKVQETPWIIGAEIVAPADGRLGIRNMESPGEAFEKDDKDFGKDLQLREMNDLARGDTEVHILSGIPNRAFVHFTKQLDDEPWETAGKLWFRVMKRFADFNTQDAFQRCAAISLEELDKSEPAVVPAVKAALQAAWREVGLQA
jgi:Zn-dependent metalloprotease